MHAPSLLQSWFRRNTGFMHVRRQAALLVAVEGLLRGGVLTLTQMGRSLRGRGHTKHKIKRMDRLLGNRRLQKECRQIYAVLATWLLRGVSQPVIVVDWSDCDPRRRWLMLTAALAVGGRALPLYQEVHPLSAYNKPKVHRGFLRALYEIVPPQCRPIVVTDAGFRGPWFRMVEALGWDWVGRVRKGVKICFGSAASCSSNTLYDRATRRVQYLGDGLLSRQHPYAAHLYLARLARRKQLPRTKSPGRNRNETRCRKSYNDPWLLATSLGHAPGMEQRVFNLYAKRMQVEETFRDLKDERCGFGLERARCADRGRREVLLLIGALALLTAWLTGLAARTRGWMRHFQANTERRHPVLSLVFLGREVLRQAVHALDSPSLCAAARHLRLLLCAQASPA